MTFGSVFLQSLSISVPVHLRKDSDLVVTSSEQLVELVVIEFVKLLVVVLGIGFERFGLYCVNTERTDGKGQAILTSSASYSAPVVTSSNLPA